MTHHLHRDVKPDNFMISTTDNKVRIIDFGLVKNFRPDRLGGDHIKLGWYPSFEGTPHFGSINALNGYNSGRRDDLEGLGYTIMELIDANQVPWRDLAEKKGVKEEIKGEQGVPVDTKKMTRKDFNDLADSKYEFLYCDDKEIPQIFLGIRDYIKECYQTDF